MSAKFDPLLEILFSGDDLTRYRQIKTFQNKVGDWIEDYINTKPGVMKPDCVKDVDWKSGIYAVGNFSRIRDNPLFDSVRHTDYVVDGSKWNMKNAWNTMNASAKTTMSQYKVNVWYRLNKDYTTNWDKHFTNTLGCTEVEFSQFVKERLINDQNELE